MSILVGENREVFASGVSVACRYCKVHKKTLQVALQGF